MTPLLEIRQATKSFGGVRANVDISLSVPEGAIIGLIGPNGSGKSTLFNAIAGTHELDAGEVLFKGEVISDLRTPDIARLGLIRTYQQTRVYHGMTALQNMFISTSVEDKSLLSLFRAQPVESAADKEVSEIGDAATELLEFVGLYSKRHMIAGELSFGQQKLLEFAMALMNGPDLLLLDEPTAGINPTLINGLIDRLHHVNQDLKITLFVIEHNMRVIMNLASHIHVLAGGKLLASGKPEEVREKPEVIEAYLGGEL